MRDLTEEGPLERLPSLRCTMLIPGDVAYIPFGSVFVEKAVGDKSSVSMRVTLPYICAGNKLHAQLLKKFHTRSPISAIYHSLMCKLSQQTVNVPTAVPVSPAVAEAKAIAEQSMEEHLAELGRFSTETEPFLSREQQEDIQIHESLKDCFRQIQEADTQVEDKTVGQARQLRVDLQAMAGTAHRHSKFKQYADQKLAADSTWVFAKTDIIQDVKDFSSWLTHLADGIHQFSVAPTVLQGETQGTGTVPNDVSEGEAEAEGDELEDDDSESGDDLESVKEAVKTLRNDEIGPYIKRILAQNVDDYYKKEPLLVQIAKRHPLFNAHIEYLQPDCGPEWVFGGPDDDTCESLGFFCEWLESKEQEAEQARLQRNEKPAESAQPNQEKKDKKKKDKSDKPAKEKKEKKDKKLKKEKKNLDKDAGTNTNKKGGGKKQSKQEAKTTSPNGKKRKAGTGYT